MKLLSVSDKGVGISELAKSLSISKGTIHGITSALEDLGVIRRDPATKRYTLGLTLFELGRKAYARIDLTEISRPVMEDLMDRTLASIFLGVINRDHVTILDIVESRHDLKITAPIGTTIPLLAGAVGKVFLATMDEAEAMRVVAAKGLNRYTEHSVTAAGAYFDEIKRTKQQGYAIDDEEYIPGVRAVASPIKGTGHLISAIWAVGFKAILNDEKMKVLSEETKRAAEAISRSIQDGSAYSPRTS